MFSPARNSHAKRKLIEFPPEIWLALDLLAKDLGTSVQALADEAFADLLRKHRRPTSLKDGKSTMLPGSSRVNDSGSSTNPLAPTRKLGSSQLSRRNFIVVVGFIRAPWRRRGPAGRNGRR